MKFLKTSYFICFCALFVQAELPCDCGLDAGTTITVGGGGFKSNGNSILDAFIEAMGGKNEPLIIFPTPEIIPKFSQKILPNPGKI